VQWEADSSADTATSFIWMVAVRNKVEALGRGLGADGGLPGSRRGLDEVILGWFSIETILPLTSMDQSL